MANMKIGFSRSDITPPVGTELGGYAGYRPCSGVHDPLYSKAVVLEQGGARYALVALDLVCVDEALYCRMAEALSGLGIRKERLIVSAIHTHAAPWGMLPGEGPLASVNRSDEAKAPSFRAYMEEVIRRSADACRAAAENLEPFTVRTGRGETPPVGSERHTGAAPGGALAVVQCKTDSGRVLTLYNFPCHPTVLSGANLQVSADFAAGIEGLLEMDMAVFLNGAAGDISTRYTRREATFAECERMGRIAAERIAQTVRNASFAPPEPVRGVHTAVTLDARAVETPEQAEKQLQSLTEQWQAAKAAGADPATLRTLHSYVEGAGVNLQFARSMGDIRQLCLPVTVFRFAGLEFATVPGELFSALQPEGLCVIGYANGYYRYLCGEEAYGANYYEAMASILARGQGERLVQEMNRLRQSL